MRETTHNTQDILRAYLYQVLGSDFVGTFDYEYYLSENTHPDVGLEFDLHKAALGLRYFDDHGWFAFAVATWREQDRDGGAFLADGVRDFWVVDAGLGYRLPKRHGSVTLELDNIFDRDFSYDQSFGFEEFIAPEFSARLLFAVNF